MLQAYTESKIDLSDNFSVNLGVYWQQLLLNDRSSLEPRAAFSYNFLPNQSISVGYGLHSQMENLGVYLARDANGIQSNKNLDFSKAHHFVVGYTINFDSDKQLKIEVYDQELYSIPVIPGSSYSMINNPGGYLNDLMINKGEGRNRGIDVTFEKYLTEGYYYLATASLYDSKYTGGDGVERNSRYNGKFACNFLFGKEFIFDNGNILGLNLRTSFTGGEYYEPVDLPLSIRQNREVLDLANAFNESLKNFYYIDISLLYRINYETFGITFALQIKNLLNEKPVTGYSYNTLLKGLDENRPLGIIPMFNCKIDF
ncbi:MAG: TonB-dependent receptor [Ignavibacteriales bacterium]|nr:TonB-dependent receptor [Ignavibacteriales bacterium]